MYILYINGIYIEKYLLHILFFSMLSFCVSYKFVRQKLDGKQFGNGIVFTVSSTVFNVISWPSASKKAPVVALTIFSLPTSAARAFAIPLMQQQKKQQTVKV